MSLELRELLRACANADTDKASDRKRWSEQIKVMLDKKAICLKLHSGEGVHCCWDAIFKCAVRIFERDHLAACKSKFGKSNKRAHDNLLLIKTVLKNSSTGGKIRLKPASVIKLLNNFLSVGDTKELYAQDLLSCVFKHFLGMKEAWINLDHKLVTELLGLLKDIMAEQQSGISFDQLSISRHLCTCIEHVISSKAGLPEGFASQSNVFFKMLRSSVISGSSVELCEYLLRICNLIVTSWFPDLRNFFCQQGEDVFLSLLNIWKRRPHEKLKIQLVMFYRMQILLHHPCGVIEEEGGAFYVTDLEEWKNMLKELLHVLVYCLNETTTRGRFSSNNSESSEELNCTFVDLVSELLALEGLGGEFLSEGDVPCPTVEGTCPPLAKRRKVTGNIRIWDWIHGTIKSNPSKAFSWTEILHSLISKYPTIIPPEDLITFAEDFILLLHEDKRTCFFENTLKCLNIIISTLHKSHGDTLKNLNLVKNLTQLVESLITARRAIDQGFMLLTHLLEFGLYTPSEDLWMLFRHDFIKPSSSSLNFILSFLANSIQTSDFSFGHRSLRLLLIRWLLPENEILGEGSNSSMASFGILTTENFPNLKLAASALSMICMTKPNMCYLNARSSDLVSKDSFPYQHLYDSFTEKSLGAAGKLLLMTSLNNFELGFLENVTFESRSEVRRSRDLTNVSLIPSVNKDVFEILLRDLQHFSSLGCNLELQQLEKQTMMCCLSLEFLFVSHKEWKCPLNDAKFFQIIEKLKVSFQKLFENMSTYFLHSNLPEAKNMVKALLGLLEECAPLAESDCAKLLRNILPSGFPDFFLKLIKSQSTEATGEMDDDDDDDLFECTTPGPSQSFREIDDFFDNSQQESSNSSMPSTGLHPSQQIMEDDQIKIVMTQWLFAWMSLCPGDNSYIISELLSLASTCDSMQMKHGIIAALTSVPRLGDDVINQIVDLIRSSSEKSSSKDQVGSKVVFNLLVSVSPHLNGEALQCVSNIITYYWRVMHDNYNEQTCLSLVKCTLALLKNDIFRNNDSEDQMLSVCNYVCKLIKKKKFLFRIMAVHIIPSLFGSFESFEIQIYSLSKSKQQKMFQSLKVAISESLENGVIPISSFLHCLIAIWKSCLVCQKKVVQFIFKIRKNCPSMSLPSFNKILSHLAEVEGSSNQKAFVTKQLLHVIKFWLEIGYSIKDFPFQILLSADIAEFLKTFSKRIIPDLAANTRHHSELEEVSLILGKNKEELISENLPEILVLLLPFLAAFECRSDKCSQSKIEDALECCKRLPVVKNFKSSLQENLIKIIQGIFLSYYDIDELNLVSEDGLSGDGNYPEPDSLHFNKSKVMLMINYLMSLYNASNFVQLISMVSDGLQIVVVEITSAFHEQTSIFEKLRIILSLELFTSLLIPNLQLISNKSLPFLIQHLFTFSTNFLHLAVTKMSTNAFKGRQILEIDQIVRIVCNMFTSFINSSAKISPQEIIYYLPLIVSCAVDLVRSQRCWSSMGFEILELLYCKIGGEITEVLKKLDPLPPIIIENLGLNDDHEVNMNLKEAVEKFLATGEYFKEASDVGEVVLNRNHGVEALLTSIRTNLCDLPQFVSNIKSDVMELPMHIDSLFLFDLMKTQFEMLLEREHYEDTELLNIASCLGLLGPINFDHAMEIEQVLNAKKFPLMSLTDEISMHCTIIKGYLSKYLVDQRTEVVRTTCSILKHLLQCEKGRNALKKLGETEWKSSRICKILHPFVHGQKDELQIAVTCDLVSLLSSDDMWKGFKASSQTFVLNLMSSTEFIKDEFLSLLGPICKLKVGLSRLLLPCLFHKILSNPGPGPSLTNHISIHFEMILSDFVERNDSSDETIEDILHVVQYLRSKLKDKGTAWDSNFWLRIDFLLLAQASLKKNKFYSALLFSEIHCLCAADIGHKEIQSVWMEAYNKIGDIDSIHGCGNHMLLEPCNRIKMLERNNEWNKSLVLSDMLLSHSKLANCLQSKSSHAGISLMKSLQKLSCHYLLDLSLSSYQDFQVHEDVKEMQYQAAWEMSNWDLNAIENLNEKSGYHEMVYGSLKALKHQNFPLLEFHVTSARKNLIKSVVANKHEGMSVASLRPILAKLRCLSELEELAQVLKDKPKLIQEVLNRWQSERYSNNFDDIELLLKQRCVLSQLIEVPVIPSTAFSQICTPSSCGSSLSNAGGIYHNHVEEIILQLSKYALKAGRLELAEKAIMTLKEMSPEVENLSTIQDWQLEEAKIFWVRGELDTAKYLIKRLIDKQENSNLGAKCLLLYGDILVETQSETPTVIMESLYEQAVKMLGEEVTTAETSVDAFYSLASYADVQYKMKVEYMESPAYDDKLELMNQAREEISKMKAKNQTDVKMRYLKTLEKQSKIDDNEIQQLKSDCKQFLIYSLENYLKCLQRSSKYDLSMYRLISLWFNNLNDSKVNEVLESHALQVASHKFVPLMYQLAARMNLSKGSFQTTLTNIVGNAATDHPHHVLPVILSLAHAKLDDSLVKNIRRSTSRNLGNNQNEVPDEERTVAAQNLIARLKRKAPNHIQLLINQMELLSRAYIELANWNIDNYKGETKAIKFPGGITLLQMSHHPSVAVATMEVPVSPSGKYSEIIHLLKVENTFSLAGGINLPKIIACRCSDGVVRKQLVKGKDDLRQDAVMQQVFNSVNGFLKRDSETRKRNLRIRTYKVVPLSRRSGLLEWCADTEPLGEYLCNSVTGAHQRYRPQDLKPIDCRKQMNMVHGTTDENEKLTTYLNICKRFQPVFRHFFMEKFLDATKWFQKRLAYTRSVATTSIVGYMIGLGDRHVQNILVDMNLAELIHIDFGVAFEQGWNLPTPETVPFRLTRDLVDGMGVTGVEGVFRRCCEKTMTAMRANREVLMTIIEVFLYDPLYDWAMSPTKAFQVQNKHNLTLEATESSENDILIGKSNNTHLNKVAKRVLLRMNQKLCGFEGSIQLSVEGHVSRLILQATDPKNLSRLFPGWQPYI